MLSPLNPDDFIISRKRKKYRFALFANSPLCFEVDEWSNEYSIHTMELGAGTGLFGLSLAKSQPERGVLAVDVKADRLQTGALAALGSGVQNIRFLRARADQLPALLKPHSIDTIWITFPDPFSKDRMAKHRLTHPQYLAIYANLLSSDGAIYFKTDAASLFSWSLERLVEAGWYIKELSYDLHESSLSDQYKVMTTYETRYVKENLPIHFVKALPHQS